MKLKAFIGCSLACWVIGAAGCSHESTTKSAASKPEVMGVPTAKTTTVAERPNVIARQGKPLTLIGAATPKVGDAAPPFTAVANDMSTFTFNPGDGITIISAVPSLDTPVCSTETKHFNQEAEKLGTGVRVLTISMDLPFAQKRWCGAEGVKSVQTVSDSRDRSFAEAYGLRIKENGLLARAVFVVGKDGKIIYEQIVPEITKEPDYAPVLEAATSAAK